MKYIRRISIILLGSVFFLAGILKLMDPLGSGLVVEEYFKFFHLGFMRPLSGVTAEGMALLETITGIALITGVWKKIVSYITLALVSFFTLVTLILVVANPEMDCGCFGEAIHLTHFQSFIKNIILLGLWEVVFITEDFEKPRKAKFVSFWISTASVLAFAVYFCYNIPARDFTSLKVGVEILPDNNESGTLSFCNAEGEYVDSLAWDGQVMIFSLYDPEKLSQTDSDRIEKCFNDCSSAGIKPLALFSGTPDEYPESFYADRRTLMALNRANGGATLICDGQIAGKWAPGDFPNCEELQELSKMDAAEVLVSSTNSSRIKLQAFLLYVFAVMLLL